MSNVLWWVTNGRAVAPPAIGWRMGVSTSTKPGGPQPLAQRLDHVLRSTRSWRVRSLAHRSTSRWR